ncbi:MAG: class I SAM-dependent methyltransferase [Pseudomonadota bacterium]
MIKSYEELVGALGREQRFRRRRFGAHELFSGAPPILFFDDLPFELKNISGSGVGATTRNEIDGPLLQINHIGTLRLVQHGEELFRGPARCARSEGLPGRVFSGFALDNDQFDLESLKRLNARVVAKSHFRLTTHDALAVEYRAFCSDVIAFVGAHCMRIERLLVPIEQSMTPADKIEVFGELMDAVKSDWRALLQKGNEFALGVRHEKSRMAAMKQYTEAAVTPVLLGGASWNRCYYKPMGYPGDFKMMNFMYDQRPEGATIRDQFLHGLGLIAGRPIYTRMLTLSRIITKHFEGRTQDLERKCASIGCGPARELEHIVEASSPQSKLVATLIDQEFEALDYAVDFARKRADERRLAINAFNTTFKSMFNPSAIGALRDQDVIYSLGLVDYFSPLLARRFVARAYDLIRPGGKVIIGNASDSLTGTYWTMEHVLDWSLFFRNKAEMADLAADAQGAKVSIESDALDSIYFLVVEKPA